MTCERRFNLLNSKFKELFFRTLLAAIAGNFAILAGAFIVSAMLGPIKYSEIGYRPKEKPDLKSEHVDILRDISDNIDHSQILGLKNTAITIEKK